MFQHVIEIPQTQEDHPIWNQQLRGQPIAVPARIRRNKIQAWKTRSRIIQLSFRVIPCGDSWLFARTKRRDCTRKTAQAIGRS